jgi:hypothetical protein
MTRAVAARAAVVRAVVVRAVAATEVVVARPAAMAEPKVAVRVPVAVPLMQAEQAMRG